MLSKQTSLMSLPQFKCCIYDNDLASLAFGQKLCYFRVYNVL